MRWHESHPFKMYSAAVFRIFTELYNHHHYLILEFSFAQEKTYPHQQSLPTAPSPGAGNHESTSIAVDLPILEILHKESYTSGLSLDTLIWHNIFRDHLCCSISCTSFLFIAEHYSVVWYHILFILASGDRHLTFHVLAIMNNAV